MFIPSLNFSLSSFSENYLISLKVCQRERRRGYFQILSSDRHSEEPERISKCPTSYCWRPDGGEKFVICYLWVILLILLSGGTGTLPRRCFVLLRRNGPVFWCGSHRLTINTCACVCVLDLRLHKPKYHTKTFFFAYTELPFCFLESMYSWIAYRLDIRTMS